MRRNCAEEALENEGFARTRARGKRAHADAPYAELRANLEIQGFLKYGYIFWA
jgi:hypothetical protein